MASFVRGTPQHVVDAGLRQWNAMNDDMARQLQAPITRTSDAGVDWRKLPAFPDAQFSQPGRAQPTQTQSMGTPYGTPNVMGRPDTPAPKPMIMKYGGSQKSSPSGGGGQTKMLPGQMSQQRNPPPPSNPFGGGGFGGGSPFGGGGFGGNPFGGGGNPFGGGGNPFGGFTPTGSVTTSFGNMPPVNAMPGGSGMSWGFPGSGGGMYQEPRMTFGSPQPNLEPGRFLASYGNPFGGAPTPTPNFAQRDALIQRLNEQMMPYQMGQQTGRPNININQSIADAGKMVQGGWSNPFAFR